MMIFGLSEPVARLSVFVGVGVLLILAEQFAPRRRRVVPLGGRWRTNALLVILDSGLVRGLAAFAPLLAAAGAAEAAAARGFGLLNVVNVPEPAGFVIALLALDGAIWLQHLVLHRMPALWRIHRVHHADRDLDVTSALRFHPLEIALSALFKAALAFVLGLPVLAVIVFEIALNAFAMFNHANLALPRWADALLRVFIVTPDMHRVHHSVHRDEHDSNFGFCLSVWDRLFGTYRAAPRDGHEGMTIGLSGHQDDQPARLTWSLAFPFLK